MDAPDVWLNRRSLWQAGARWSICCMPYSRRGTSISAATSISCRVGRDEAGYDPAPGATTTCGYASRLRRQVIGSPPSEAEAVKQSRKQDA